MTTSKKKKILYYSILVVFLALIFYVLRGPNISNELKKAILPELEEATGKKFVAQKIYVNLIPFFVEIKDLKAFDDDGNKVLTVERVKGYLSVTGFFDKQIVIKRLVIKKMRLYSNEQKVEDVIRHVTRYVQKESKFPLKVVIKSIQLDDADLSYTMGDTELGASGLHADILLGKNPRFRITARELSAKGEKIPPFQASLETVFSLQDNALDVSSFRLFSGNSQAQTGGLINLKSLQGALSTELLLAFDSFKQVFNLKSPADGRIRADGKITLQDGKTLLSRIVLDLGIRGEFYLESLMEILKVEEKLLGWVRTEGKVTGSLADIRGTGTAELTKGNLFDVEIDRLKCSVDYAQGQMHFRNAEANLYNGTATASAMIVLPVVHTFHLTVKAHEVDSSGIFKLIRWDPGIAVGKVSGELSTAGKRFEPDGHFVYRNDREGRDVLQKVRAISGTFSMRGTKISFPNMHIATRVSEVATSGVVDIGGNALSFTGNGSTKDFLDFFSPYFTSLSGPASFQVALNGKLDDPALSVQFAGTNDTFVTSGPEIPDFMQKSTLHVDRFDGSVRYQKNVLTLNDVATRTGKETIRATGKVVFQGGKHLFDIRNPDYDLSVRAQGITVQNLVDSIQDAPAFVGVLDAAFTVSGLPRTLAMKGTAVARNFGLKDAFAFQEADTSFVFEKKRFLLSPFRLKTAGSVLLGRGMLSFDKTFDFRAEGSNLNATELLPDGPKAILAKRNIRTLLIPSLQLSGSGSFDRPSISLQGTLFSSASRGQSIGKGTFSGELHGRTLDIAASLLDNRVVIKAQYELRHPFPWHASVDMASARGDFLLTSFFPEAPDDLIVNLKGRMEASGSKTSPMQGSLHLDKALFYAYGIGLSNVQPIVASLREQQLSFQPITLRGESAELVIKGGLSIGSHYDLHFEGKTSLGPLKMIVKEFDTTRGDAQLVASITGAWDAPKINGDLTLANATFGMGSLPYRLTDVSGYVVFDEDKILIKKVDGKLAGGNITGSGVVRLNAFAWDRFYFESKFNGSSFSLPQRLTANIDGSLMYQGSRDKQTISGDITVKRANYSERVDLVSLILKSKEREVPNRELTAFDRTNLNIKVSGQNITLQNNLAYALLTMDGYVRGTVAKPILFGKVETAQGDVYFRNNEFRIQKATIDFADPARNRPYISVLATSRVSSYQVRLTLDGYPDQFALALASDPPLSESDIVNLLALGQTGQSTQASQKKDSGGSIGLGGATSFLAGSLQETLQDRIKTVTGIDRIVIEPAVSRASGTVTPRVSAQKRLLNDKMLVTYSAAAGTGEEQIWKVEYLLSKSASLVGQRDEKGGVGGDIKFRFEFR